MLDNFVSMVNFENIQIIIRTHKSGNTLSFNRFRSYVLNKFTWTSSIWSREGVLNVLLVIVEIKSFIDFQLTSKASLVTLFPSFLRTHLEKWPTHSKKWKSKSIFFQCDAFERSVFCFPRFHRFIYFIVFYFVSWEWSQGKNFSTQFSGNWPFGLLNFLHIYYMVWEKNITIVARDIDEKDFCLSAQAWLWENCLLVLLLNFE